MGCNCAKDKIELSIRKKLRREMKEKLSDIKKLWKESKTQTTVTTNKKELNFKQLYMLDPKRFWEYVNMPKETFDKLVSFHRDTDAMIRRLDDFKKTM